jgi:hypothetical protein
VPLRSGTGWGTGNRTIGGRKFVAFAADQRGMSDQRSLSGAASSDGGPVTPSMAAPPIARPPIASPVIARPPMAVGHVLVVAG